MSLSKWFRTIRRPFSSEPRPVRRADRPAPRARLSLQALDERLAPSATRLAVLTPAVVHTSVAAPVEVVALNAAGRVDTSFTGTVKLTGTDAGTALAASAYAFTAADRGVHFFHETATRAGAERVVATASASGSLTGSASASVTSTTATHFLLVAQPGYAGEPDKVIVEAL